MADRGCYVWIWLPGDSAPTLCGYLRWNGRAADFAYVKSYLSRPDAISIAPQWPTRAGNASWYPPQDDPLPGAIADVAPGRWAEYVLEKMHGAPLDAFDRLLQGASDRTGALAFSASHLQPPAEQTLAIDLQTIAHAVTEIDAGRPISAPLASVFQHGPSLGGRRPKASIRIDGELWIGKFCSVQDRDASQPRLEAFGLTLARACGIEIPDFRLVAAGGKPVLLVKRFDRNARGERRHVLTARTLLNLSERQCLSDGAYPAVARMLRTHGQRADEAALWFDRMVFNVVLGNTDDHPLNHLFAWDGDALRLMPAFDLEPQDAAAHDRRHEMIIGQQGRLGSLANALSMHAEFGLRRAQAEARVQRIVDAARAHWRTASEAHALADSQAVLHSMLPEAQAEPGTSL